MGGIALIPVMKEAVKLIIDANPDIRIIIARIGAGVAIKQTGEGIIDIGDAGFKSRQLPLQNLISQSASLCKKAIFLCA